MFCPNCGAEYREGFSMCSECNVPLVDKLPADVEPEFIKFVTVYETGDPAFIAFAKSILQSEGIRYYFKGEGIQDLFAGGRLGTGYNPAIGPVQIQVDEKDADKAKDLLRQIDEDEFERSEKDVEYSHGEQVEDRTPKGHTLRALSIGVLIGVVISVIGFVAYTYWEKHFPGVEKYDLNKDSKPDLFYYYKNGVIVKVEQDRNFDAKIDLWDFYKDGSLDHGVSDDNFDGVVDKWFNFKNGLLARFEIDTNSDNKPEIVEYYTNEVLSEKLWIHESSRKIWKRALFYSGVMTEEYIDQDYDGTLDIKITYDLSERPIKTISLH